MPRSPAFGKRLLAPTLTCCTRAQRTCWQAASLPSHVWQLVLQLSNNLVDLGHHFRRQPRLVTTGGQAEDLPSMNRAEEADRLQELTGRRVDLRVVSEESGVDLEGMG